MKKQISLFILFALIIAVGSCKKDSNQTNSYNSNQIKEYIKFTFDGVPYIYTYSTDTIENGYFYGQNLNQINLIRSDRYPKTKYLAIYIHLFESLDSLQVPATLTPESTGSAGMELIDLVHHVDTMFSSTDNYNYSCYHPTLTIISKANDTLTGNFSGNLKTSTGFTKPISGGEFKIKIFRKTFE